jgi:hypothetical protein
MASKSLKPPIYNPYDKFTKPEFDEWIGDITDALRMALGHRTKRTRARPIDTEYRVNTYSDDIEHDYVEEDESDAVSDASEGVDDSLSHLNSRSQKGKARDPLEGPGLGRKNQPIEIVSDSEEDEGHPEIDPDDHLSGDSYEEDHPSYRINPANEPIELTSDEEDEPPGDEGESRHEANAEESFNGVLEGWPYYIDKLIAISNTLFII